MKKIILAPAVAAAIGGLGVAPVVLAPAVVFADVSEAAVTVSGTVTTDSTTVEVTIADLEEGETADVTLNGPDGAAIDTAEDVGNGTVTLNVSDLVAGATYTIDLVDSEDPGDAQTSAATFTVEPASDEDDGDDEQTPDPAPTSNEGATVTVEPSVVSAEALTNENEGVAFIVSNLMPGTTVANDLTADEATADEQGMATVAVYYDGPASSFEPGQEIPVVLTLTDPDGNESTLNTVITIEGEAPGDDEDGDETQTPGDDETDDSTSTPTDDQWTWEFGELSEGLNLEADQVSTEKFVTDGVAFAVLGCEPGQDVTFSVSAGRDDVQAYEETVVANEDGIAVHGVMGTDPESARAYIGEYTVTATCGDNEWTDSFYVGEREDDDANAGAEDDTNNDDDNTAGSNLPRTGTELTGLAAGAGLLVLGAATVFMTRRRTAKNGPADI